MKASLLIPCITVSLSLMSYFSSVSAAEDILSKIINGIDEDSVNQCVKTINNIPEDGIGTAERTYSMGMCHFCIDCDFEVDNGQLFIVNNIDNYMLKNVSLSESYKIAHKLLTQAANLGHRDAYYGLGIMLYINDLGKGRQYHGQVYDDRSTLNQLNNKANKTNQVLDEHSSNSINVLFSDALIKASNNSFNHQIYKYLLVAAKQGYMPAQFALSEVYFKGIGVEPNHVQAYAWASVAVAQNPPFGSLRRDEKAINFDAIKLNKAQALAEEYTKKYANIFENSSVNVRH